MGNQHFAPRQEGWDFGRTLRDRLLEQYRQESGVDVPPPPALIGAELLTDFLGVKLTFDLLPRDRYGEIRWVNGEPHITINSSIPQMDNVKDAQGVENVAVWHEGVHAVCDGDVERDPLQGLLPGFSPPPEVICYRRQPWQATDVGTWREFWAEEAGRAAAVSRAHLNRSKAFLHLVEKGGAGGLPNGEAWRLLAEAAADIGVNRTALVTQLTYEGVLAVNEESGRKVVYVMRNLLEVA